MRSAELINNACEELSIDPGGSILLMGFLRCSSETSWLSGLEPAVWFMPAHACQLPGNIEFLPSFPLDYGHAIFPANVLWLARS